MESGLKGIAKTLLLAVQASGFNSFMHAPSHASLYSVRQRGETQNVKIILFL